MAENEYKRLLIAAKERALTGLLSVVQRAMQDTDKYIVEQLSEARSGLDHSTLTSVRHFLRQDGNVFLRRMDELYRNSLERAMQTMYVDLRAGMRNKTANELSLIDDDAVTHQIEVGKLAERMRDANEEHIGRLNVIIAQLHGQREAKERENPFRPYLLARALYEAIKDTANDETKARVLFDQLSNALAQHLPGYYQSIREVFETSGVFGRFQAQRSRAAHNQRYFGAPPMDPSMATRVMPGLHRMLESMQAGGANGPQGESVEDFIRQMFMPSRSIGFGLGGDPLKVRDFPPNPLVAKLSDFQSKAARKEPVAAAIEPGKNALPALREQMGLDNASPTERMTVDVVSMLFEFILTDDQVTPEMRRQIGRLQVPILKAALLDQELMHDETHPVRLLLNRLGTAAVSADPVTPAGRTLTAEIERVVDKVLAEFGTDTAVFATCANEFEAFLTRFLRKEDNLAARGIDAVEDAERFSVLLTNVTKALCDVLVPLNVDKRISDVIILVWPHVLVHAAWQDKLANIGQDDAAGMFRQFHSALPELVWSLQEKSPQQRTALIRLLPDLVKRLRKALDIIQLPEEDAKQILDQLVDMHTQVLRGQPKPGAPEQLSLDDLRKEFARVAFSWDRASWELPEPPAPREDIILEIFTRHGANADLNLGVNTVSSTAADRDFLAQTYLLGTRVAFRGPDGGKIAGQLVWISTHRSLYLFKQEGKTALAVYSPAALLEALRAEAIIPVEYAPVFERAVESLLFGAGSIANA
ncbi:DUF1631 family protein [Noviherbaspirillum denitrificans]|uniref:Thymidine phosphorylase n=1 Tax=Noviherbaspirillum denitrificans TaxID=1968433 RepID=A0A254TJE4_9BURK|nr:DUF1631 family protein [Noviherbaspirillum denitrificans]OWW19828.1 hypothetical protein AYR66_10275 [Noviherbaspirillum denitrificans]